MNQASTIPATVAAEIFGGGSFFGSCQVAAGNFEEVLLSASEAQSSAVNCETVGILNTEDAENADNEEFSESAEKTEEFIPVATESEDYEDYESSENSGIVDKHDKVAVNNNDNEITANEPIVNEPVAKEAIEPIAKPATYTENAKSKPEPKFEPKQEQKLEQKQDEDLAVEAQPNGILQMFFNYFEELSQNEVLAQLQQILGEEAGAEAFEIITDLIKKGAPSVQANTDEHELSDIILTLKRLQDFFEKKSTFEIPPEEQKTRVEGCIEELEEVLQTIQANNTEKPVSDIEEFKDTPFLTKRDIVNCQRLAVEMEIIKPKEIIPPEHEFLKLINDLLEQGLITSEDLEQALKIPYKHNEDYSFVALDFSEKDLEAAKKIEPKFFRETLENLWECIETENEPEKENLFSMLKQIANVRETGKELKAALDMENDFEVEEEDNKTFEAKRDFGVKRNFKDFNVKEIKAETNVKDANDIKEVKDIKDVKAVKSADIKSDVDLKRDFSVRSNPVAEQSAEKNISSLMKDKPSEEKPVVPEVRAVWEGEGYKIEVVNPKTGEKLQTTQTAMPQNMQEKIQEFEIVKQVIARAKFITTPIGEQKMTLFLRPDNLGSVDMRISLYNGEMQIHARVDTQVAQHALENQIGLLREGLEKQGITLDRLEVSVEQRENRDAGALAHEHENQRNGDRNGKRRRGRAAHFAVSTAKDENSDTGRRLGYNTMEYLA